MHLPDKATVHRVIFGTDTRAGQLFDITLLCVIVASVIVATLDSLETPHRQLHAMLLVLEWGFTLIFTVEYGLRLWCSPHPWRYARSFFGVIDLLAVLPTYLGLFYADANLLLVIRLVRVLRVFRILRLFAYWNDANMLLRSLYSSRRKITVFLATVFVAAIIFGALLYVVEGPEHGFTSIPKSIYWAVITITTVGYGDLVPKTGLGQAIATLVMLVGYSVIAIPTGIFTSDLLMEMQRQRNDRHCPDCAASGHESDAKFCRHCGHDLSPDVPDNV
ncbi:MAG TPA: ion transporter [Moraxellaceae bacterium]|nr:ion transporter [Moraxellaceae bacterium]